MKKTSPALSRDIDNRWTSKVTEYEKLLCDGCFDLFHFGHANAFRQAKDFGGILVAAIHTDEEIARSKGSLTVYPWSERLKILTSIRWIDEIIPDAPYSFSLVDLKRFAVDYTVHGDDISIGADGRDCHAEVKAAGMYKIIRRTRGVSSTKLLATLLDAVSSLPSPDSTNDMLADFSIESFSQSNNNPSFAELEQIAQNLWCASSIYGPKIIPVKQSKLKITSSLSTHHLNETTCQHNLPRITYVCGSFDLFHAGTVSFLESVRKRSDYLIVGIFSCEMLRHYLGPKFPLFSLEQRAMCVSACKYVDEILLNPPLVTSQDIIDSFGVTSVAVLDFVPGRKSKAAFLDYGVSLEGHNLVGVSIVVIQPSNASTNFDTIMSRIIKNSIELEKTRFLKQSKTIELTLPGGENFFSSCLSI